MESLEALAKDYEDGIIKYTKPTGLEVLPKLFLGMCPLFEQ